MKNYNLYKFFKRLKEIIIMSIHSHHASDFYFMHLYSEIMCEVLSKEVNFHSTVQVGPTVLIKG